MDIDHLVPLKEAHQSGAYAWDQAKRKAFANELKDSEHLIAVAASANRSKGAKDPAEWLPPNKAFWKSYAQAWVNIKIRWNLKADAAELSRLKLCWDLMQNFLKRHLNINVFRKVIKIQ